MNSTENHYLPNKGWPINGHVGEQYKAGYPAEWYSLSMMLRSILNKLDVSITHSSPHTMKPNLMSGSLTPHSKTKPDVGITDTTLKKQT